MDSRIADGLQKMQNSFVVEYDSEFESFSEMFSLLTLEFEKLENGNGNVRAYEETERLNKKLEEEKKKLDNQKMTIDSLRSQIEDVNKQKMKIENRTKYLKGENQVLVDQILELKREKTEINEHYLKLKYKCGLYRNAARVCWDESSEHHDIQGFVVGNSSLKPFNFSLKENSTVFISHFIWKLISEGMEKENS